jgi:long-subunit acyl-CoA synthetase (AMP-forming)
VPHDKRLKKAKYKKPSAKKRDHSQPRSIADRLILAQVDQILPGNALLMLVTGTALAKHLTQLRP